MGSSRTPSGVDTGKPPKSCGSRIDPTRTSTLHLMPARSNPASRLLVNSVLPTPGKPVMCIGIRACRPMAMSRTKCLKSMRGEGYPLRHRGRGNGQCRPGLVFKARRTRTRPGVSRHFPPGLQARPAYSARAELAGRSRARERSEPALLRIEPVGEFDEEGVRGRRAEDVAVVAAKAERARGA